MSSSRELKWWRVGVLVFFVIVTVAKVASDDPKLAVGGLYVVPLVIATAYGWRWGALVLMGALGSYALLPPELSFGGVLVRMAMLSVVLLTLWRFHAVRQGADRYFKSLQLNEDVLQRLIVAKYELERHHDIRNESLDAAIDRARALITNGTRNFAPGTLRTASRDESPT